MFGLAVNLIVSVSGHPWIIDEINKKKLNYENERKILGAV